MTALGSEFNRLQNQETEMVQVKFKKLHPNAKLPTRGTPVAAGLDLYSVEDWNLPPGLWRAVPTGLAIALPEGYEGQVRSRSGMALKMGTVVLNGPGTIDEDYRGEVKVLLINHSHSLIHIAVGDRIGQLVIAPVTRAMPVLVEELDTTTRGSNGFGSTGT